MNPKCACGHGLFSHENEPEPRCHWREYGIRRCSCRRFKAA